MPNTREKLFKQNGKKRKKSVRIYALILVQRKYSPLSKTHCDRFQFSGVESSLPPSLGTPLLAADSLPATVCPLAAGCFPGGWLLPLDRLPWRLAAASRSASLAAALPGGYLLIPCSRLSVAVCSPSIFKIRCRDS